MEAEKKGFVSELKETASTTMAVITGLGLLAALFGITSKDGIAFWVGIFIAIPGLIFARKEFWSVIKWAIKK